jgi:hypothetical protein
LWPSHSDSTDLYLTERLPNAGFGTPQKIVSASSPLRGSSLAVGAMGKIYVAYSTPTESRLWARRPGKPPTDQRWPTYPPAALGADDWLILTETKTDAAGDFIQATVRSPKAKEGKTARLSGDSPARHQTLVRGPSGRAIAFWWEHPAGEAPHLEAAYHKP